MTTAKVTQQAVEVLHTSTAVPAARVTQQAVEVLHTSTAVPAARVTQQAVEVLYTYVVPTNVAVTSQWVESLQNSTSVPNVAVTSQWVEYIVSNSAPVFVEVTNQWVEYISKMPNYAKVTQEYVETLSKPSSVSAAVTEEYAEVLSVPQTLSIAVTQEYAESISQRVNNAFSSAVYCETISSVWTSLFPARVTEIYAECVSATGLSTRIHNTSAFAEIIHKTDTSERVSEVLGEIHYKPTIVNASVSQLFVETIRKTRGTSTSININSPL